MPRDASCPVYFTSYRRDDRSKYLNKFLEALADSVASEAGMTVAAVRFEDLASVDSGAIWTDEVVDALRRAHVLIALYSPWYFRSNPDRPCYTGREVAAFLERARLAGRKPCILPILWTTRRSLAREHLPPAVLASVQYGLPSARPTSPGKRAAWSDYNERGLLEMVREAGRINGRVQMIISGLVHQIMEMDDDPPPELTDFDFHDGTCAFHSGPDGCSGVPRVSLRAVSPQRGPNQLLVVDFTTPSAEPEQGGRTPLGMAVDVATDEALYSTPTRWADDQAVGEVLEVLETAWERNQMILLTVSSDRLADEAIGSVLRAALQPTRDWVIGIAVFGDVPLDVQQNDRVAVGHLAELNPSDWELKQLMMSVRQRMARFGKVSVPDDRAGHTGMPRF
jgi:TIR domain